MKKCAIVVQVFCVFIIMMLAPISAKHAEGALSGDCADHCDFSWKKNKHMFLVALLLSIDIIYTTIKLTFPRMG